MSNQINTNILNPEYRKNFLRKADVNGINEYLKYMEKLSKRGPNYLQLYSDDIDFLLNSNDSAFQIGGNIFSLLTGKKENNQIVSEVCDTQNIVNKLNNITGNSFCSLTTQKTKKCDNRCETRMDELNNIRDVLKKENSCASASMDWIPAIRKFSDIVLCCGSVFSQAEYEPFRTIHFKEIAKIISHNPKFTKESFNYLARIFKNEKNKLSDEFMKKYHELRKKKNSLSSEQYHIEKSNLITTYINKYGDKGFEIVYASKLFEKVINSYRMLQTKPL